MAKGPTTNNLEAEVRTRTGKGASRQARRDGKVPAVLYARGSQRNHIPTSPPCFATPAPTRC